MINKNFYPSPKELINKMTKSINFTQIQSILEPSAGKGDIVEYCIEQMHSQYGYNRHKKPSDFDIDCIELDTELQATLKGKGFRVVHNDFLTFNTYKHYDLIIMNPPFDNGDKHLIKAIKMQSNGGAIVCILNAETIRNTFSNTRKELKNLLTQYNATIEFIKNGFTNAERKTDTEVALVKILIPNKKVECEWLNDLKKKENVEEKEHTPQDVSKFCEQNNFIDSIVEQYNNEIQLGLMLLDKYQQIKPYITQCIDPENNYEKAPIFCIKFDGYENKDIVTPNTFIQKVRGKYWKGLFSNKNFISKLTSNLVKDLMNNIEKLQEYDFSVYNIMTIQQEMIKQTVGGIEDTILNLFDEFTRQYSWYPETKNNIHYYNGWATNKAYKINKKIIIPFSAYDSCWGRFEPRWQCQEKFNDIIKVMNFLATKNNLNVDVQEILSTSGKENKTKDIDFGYFTATFYKKGTCHITFKDTDLLAKLNLFGSQKKQWLPYEYGRKAYKDMSPQEKDLVKEFSTSEEEYNKIYNNADYYIIDFKQELLLTE